jgi:Fe-S cluster assembly iron-binding protein IscA
MLTLTENASTAVKTIAGQSAEAAGLRITAENAATTELNLSVVAQPEPTDSIVEIDGALVFLEPVASGILDDKILDARVEENGSVSFAIGAQV